MPAREDAAAYGGVHRRSMTAFHFALHETEDRTL
jgi:hypothetical protein